MQSARPQPDAQAAAATTVAQPVAQTPPPAASIISRAPVLKNADSQTGDLDKSFEMFLSELDPGMLDDKGVASEGQEADQLEESIAAAAEIQSEAEVVGDKRLRNTENDVEQGQKRKKEKVGEQTALPLSTVDEGEPAPPPDDSNEEDPPPPPAEPMPTPLEEPRRRPPQAVKESSNESKEKEAWEYMRPNAFGVGSFFDFNQF